MATLTDQSCCVLVAQTLPICYFVGVFITPRVTKNLN
jgi:hypothetical protein